MYSFFFRFTKKSIQRHLYFRCNDVQNQERLFVDMLHLTQGEKNEQKMIPTAYRDIGKKKYLSANNVAPIICK